MVILVIKKTTMKTTKIFGIISFIIILTCQSSKSQDIGYDKNTIEILNLLLPKNDSVCLFKEAYYTGNRKTPVNSINHYFRVYNSKKNTAIYELSYKDVNGIITIGELNEMKARYTSWSMFEWDHNQLNNKKIFLISIKDKNLDCYKIYRIYEPLYTKDKKKAIVQIYSSIGMSGSTGLTILKKENGKWEIKGGIPIGTSG